MVHAMARAATAVTPDNSALMGIAKLVALEDKSNSDPLSKSIGSEGSAFLIDAQKGLVLTALHNLHICANQLKIRGSLKNNVLVGKVCPGQSLRLSFPLTKSWSATSGIKILAHGNLDENDSAAYQDWALLQLNCDWCKKITPFVLARELPKVGDPISLVGFPSDTSVGEKIHAPAGLRVSKGIVEDKNQVEAEWNLLYTSLGTKKTDLQSLKDSASRNFFNWDLQIYHTAPIIGGYSGGPMLNENMEVVGINWGAAIIWHDKIGGFPNALKFDYKDHSKLSNHMAAAHEVVSWLPELLHSIE